MLSLFIINVCAIQNSECVLMLSDICLHIYLNTLPSETCCGPFIKFLKNLVYPLQYFLFAFFVQPASMSSHVTEDGCTAFQLCPRVT